MYSDEFQGKNIFTKLGDVIDLQRKEPNDVLGALVKKSNMNVIIGSGLVNKIKKEEEVINKSK